MGADAISARFVSVLRRLPDSDVARWNKFVSAVICKTQSYHAFAGQHQRRGQFPRRSGGHTRQTPTVGFFRRHQSPLSHLVPLYPRQVLPSPTACASNVPQARRRIATAITSLIAVLLFADFQGRGHVMTVPIRSPGHPGTIGTAESRGRYLAAISSRVRRSLAPFVSVLGRGMARSKRPAARPTWRHVTRWGAA